MSDKTKEVSVVEVKAPAVIISEAIAKGANLKEIAELMTLQERWEGNQAKKAYVHAMADFKANAPLVDKDKVNKQYNSKYTTLGNLINTVSPVLSKFGLSASWDIEQNGIIKVTCKMTHDMGHSETASMSAPADVSGSKNVIQQIKSTITYLKAVTFESICGLASTDANVDDDGQTAVTVEYITDKERSELTDMAVDAGASMPKLIAYLKVEDLSKLEKKDLAKAKLALNANKARKEKEAKK
jgi:hypothetical protein